MFYTQVPLELSQLVVTLDCISTRKLNLFCLSNIVFKCKKWVLPAPGVSDTFTMNLNLILIYSGSPKILCTITKLKFTETEVKV